MSARISTLFVLLMLAGSFTGLYAQSPGDLFNVGFSRDVVVGDKILPAGSWDIRWEDSRANPMLKFKRGNTMSAEFAAVSVTREDNKKSAATEAVVETIGPDDYLTNIWIKGERTGYAFRLPPETRLLRHGEVQRIPASFMSGSWFTQGAQIEGQSRSHVGQGLGNPGDRSSAGFVAQIPLADATSLPSYRGLNAISTTEVRPETTPVQSGEIAQSETPLGQEGEVTQAASPPSVDSFDPEQSLPADNDAALNPEVEGIVSPDEQSPTEVAELTPFEQPSEIEPPSAETPGLPEEEEQIAELPATASYWPAYLLIGFAAIVLSQMVRRRI